MEDYQHEKDINLEKLKSKINLYTIDKNFDQI